MAHRLGAVIVPQHENEDDYLDRVLELFSQHRSVPPYKVETGEHWSVIVADARAHYPDLYPKTMGDLDVLNEQAFTGERWTAEREGDYQLWSLNNPDGEIDWWVIGGRYDGKLGTMNREPVEAARERFDRLDGWPRLPSALVTTAPELLNLDRGHDGSPAAQEAAQEAWIRDLRDTLDRAPAGGHMVYIDIHV